VPLDPAVEKAMLAAVPDLHGFAIALCRRADRADDLVQQALLHAIDRIELFKPGTNMTAWLFTILRNNFCNEFRKRRREVSDSGEYLTATMAAQPEQESRIRFAEFRAAPATAWARRPSARPRRRHITTAPAATIRIRRADRCDDIARPPSKPAADECSTLALPVRAVRLVLRQALRVLRHLQAGQQLDIARRPAGVVLGLHAVVALRPGKPVPRRGKLRARGLLIVHAGVEAARHDGDGGPARGCNVIGRHVRNHDECG